MTQHCWYQNLPPAKMLATWLMTAQYTHSSISITRYFFRFRNAALSILLCFIKNIDQMSQKVIMARAKLWNKFNLSASVCTRVHSRWNNNNHILCSIWAITGEQKKKSLDNKWERESESDLSNFRAFFLFVWSGKSTQNFFCFETR